jgi:hypothetical protein
MRESHFRSHSFGDPTLGRFVRRRDQLNHRLEESRLGINEWLAHQTMPTSLPAVARLEALIARQRDLHSELAALEDDFMHYLLRVRQGLKTRN